MRDLRIAVIFVSGLVVLSAAACGAQSASQGTGPTRSERLSTVSAKDFDRANFGNNSAIVNNKWFPLKPGAYSAFEGSAIDTGERVSRRVESTVTDLTKVINGVNTVVVLENDITSGELEESELSFYAQDKDGNVWHMGEYPEEYDSGKFVKAPGWLAGSEGATAGIMMRAQPRTGTPSYSEGYAPPPISWKDRGKVYKVGQKTCVPVKCYKNVLVIEEFERDKPGAYQTKYYAPGVGNVRVGWRGPNEDERETLSLVKDTRLSPEALVEARESALKLEKHAYKLKDFYRKTQPAKPTLRVGR